MVPMFGPPRTGGVVGGEGAVDGRSVAGVLVGSVFFIPVFTIGSAFGLNVTSVSIFANSTNEK